LASYTKYKYSKVAVKGQRSPHRQFNGLAALTVVGQDVNSDFDVSKFHLGVLVHDDHVDHSSGVQVRVKERAPFLVHSSSPLC